MTVSYEWDVELCTAEESDEYEENEVLDHTFCSSYAEAVQAASQVPEEGCKNVLVLVRTDDNSRAWAYLEDGKLPEYFSDAYGNDVAKVPQKYHKEVASV